MADAITNISQNSLEEQIFQLAWYFLGIQKVHQGVTENELDYISIEHDTETGEIDISIKLPVTLASIGIGDSVMMTPKEIIPKGVPSSATYS